MASESVSSAGDFSSPDLSDEGLLPELDAMQAVAAAVESLSPEERRRVLRWAMDRYVSRSVARVASPEPVIAEIAPPPVAPSAVASEPAASAATEPTRASVGVTSAPAAGTSAVPSTSAELLAALHTRTDAQRVLAVAYWFQFVEGRPDLDAMTLNRELKNLGHGVTNITGVLTRLMEGRPQLVLQLKKSGSSRQARKKYKLTAAGKQRVEAMLGAPHAPEHDEIA